MYCDPNFKTKKALKEAIAAGKPVSAYQPGGMFPGATDGWVCIEGPPFPEPHRWYARALLKEGMITRIK